MVNIDQIKQLREETCISLAECKKALNEADGDIEKAKDILKKWGKDLAGKKSLRETGQGIIESYIHSNKKVGVLLDIRCETDFVSKGEDFQNFAHELCLQIAAARPLFIKDEDIPKDILTREKNIYEEQARELKKSEEIVEGILEGKMEKYKQSICLLSQPWIKDESKTVKNLIEEYIAKIGENIVVKSFTRYEL